MFGAKVHAFAALLLVLSLVHTWCFTWPIFTTIRNTFSWAHAIRMHAKFKFILLMHKLRQWNCSHHRLLMNWRMCELGKVNGPFEILCQRLFRVCQKEEHENESIAAFSQIGMHSKWKRRKNSLFECCGCSREKVEIRFEIECGVICLDCGTMRTQLKQCMHCGDAQKWDPTAHACFALYQRVSVQSNAMQDGSL